MKRNEVKGIRGIALFQVMILITATIAVAYSIGSEFEVVSAAGEKCIKDAGNRNVFVTTITNVNNFCAANGGSLICNGGSGQWSLRSDKIFDCPTPAGASTTGPGRQPGVSSLDPAQKPLPPFPQQNKNSDLGLSDIPSVISAKDAYDRIRGTSGKTAAEAAGQAAPGVRRGILERIFSRLGVPDSAAARVASKTTTVFVDGLAAVGIYYGAKAALSLLGDRISPNDVEQISKSLGWGYFAGRSAVSIFGKSAVFGLGVGIAVAIGTWVFSGDTQYNAVVFSCNPWSPTEGGSDCEKCNDGDFPCTEYRCKSLGQSCELLNQGTGEEACVWVNRGDVNAPVIQPLTSVLTNGYSYTPDNTISPPDRGVRIVPSGNITGCVVPYTNLRFGLTVDEPAKCSIDTEPKSNFSDMRVQLSSGLLKYNHSFQLSLPGPEALEAENISLLNGGKMSIYARCKDAAGNANVANFVFGFCVDNGPDRTQPRIVETSILNNMPIAFGQQNVALDVYVNEPAACKWSRLDKSYDDMETNMTCATTASAMNARMLYTCSTTLTGMKDMSPNDFYFRCMDQPHLAGTNRSHERNINSQSYKFTLQGTRQLAISSAGPNNTKMTDSTNVIKVTLNATTIAGYKEGEAVCSFKNMADNEDYLEFYNTGKNKHSQELYLPASNYTFSIRCVDLGGNADTKTVNFQVETDLVAPNVVRVFKQESVLKVITDERALCVYGNTDCNYLFEDGIKMSQMNATNGTSTEHTAGWDTSKNYYVKCQDRFKNTVAPDQCNIVAKPFEIKTSA